MCGIWLWIKNELASPSLQEDTSLYIQGRGPDQTKNVDKPGFRAVFHRLAIQDLSQLGMQPFVYREGDSEFYLLCNGEIYNYVELKKEYCSEGDLQSNSDCEIILFLFLRFLKNIHRVLEKIRGEFAFVILESSPHVIKGYAARDPYGVRPLFTGTGNQGLFFSSLLKGVAGVCEEASPFHPGQVCYFEGPQIMWTTFFYFPPSMSSSVTDLDTLLIYKQLTDRLIGAVKKRLLSERPMGALLSGGLDSSLLVAIIYKILQQKVRVFTIGLEGCESTDLEYAKEVIDHLGIQDYDLVTLSPEVALSRYKDVIGACESYDITTIRASIMHYSVAKYIKENTDIKVILNGDGADEVQMGYLYMKMAPSEDAARLETKKLLEEIFYFDGLRVDRCLGAFGLEARLPYLDVDFVDYFLALPDSLKVPFQRQEKSIIREAFATLYPGLLPDSVLFRQKEAFSDGVSSEKNSWYKTLQDYFAAQISDETMENNPYFLNRPFSKESMAYRLEFQKQFNKNGYCYDHVIPHFWQPNWTNIQDPSARELAVYQEDSKN